jgi:O-antigen biosynthesis protein
MLSFINYARKEFHLKIKRSFVIIKEQGFLYFLKKTAIKIKLLNTYRIWIEQNEEKNISYQKEIKFPYEPKIDIIIPVFNPPVITLRATINSVLNQTYSNWELCIADGNSNNTVKGLLQGYVGRDSRIKVVFLDKNKGIAGNMNEALQIATGDFAGFLDHDDELHPSALYEVVKLLNEDKEIDFIYTDEDKISTGGERFEAHFKPDWAPDTFRSYNYICHFAVIRKSTIDKAGSFKPDYEGSQDYDFFLRVTEVTKKIVHIPKVLYHWRVHKDSVAGNARTKIYAYENAKKALREHIQRLGLKGEVLSGHSPGRYRVKYNIENNPPVSIIIPNKNYADTLKKCIDSILNKTSYTNYKIYIVDNQSKEEKTFTYYNKLENISKINIIYHDKPLNFTAINNYVISLIDSEYIVFLNNNTEVITPSWIESMLEIAQRSDVGVVGAKLYYPNDTIQHAGVIIFRDGRPTHSFRFLGKQQEGYMSRAKIIQNYSAVTAACMMTKRSIFEEIGGFDERFTLAYNDVDFCLKIREKGYLVVWTPYAELYHHESKTRGYNTAKDKKELLLLKSRWGKVMDKGDPYYNPNLTTTGGDFSLNIR